MSATSARSEVIKLANKRNLSHVAKQERHRCETIRELSSVADRTTSRLTLIACALTICLVLSPATQLLAQVPPRSEAAQEQREEKAPRKDELFILQDYTLELPLFCELVFQKDHKEARINFCAGKVTYGGDMEVTESARLFFEIVMKHRVGCKPSTKEKREE